MEASSRAHLRGCERQWAPPSTPLCPSAPGPLPAPPLGVDVAGALPHGRACGAARREMGAVGVGRGVGGW